MSAKSFSKPKTKQMLGRYAGEWVVFVDDAIIAHNKELPAAMAEAKKKGLDERASVFLVPRKDEGPYVLLIIP